MSKKPSLIELKTTLQKKTQHELVEEIAHLYKKFSNVKEYYQASMFDDDAAVLEKYKKIVRDEFVPTTTRFPKMRASVARQAISNYKKVSCSSSGIADIMLSYVEAGVDCTSEFGDINEPFYNSMESMYESALKYMVKENLFYDFEERLEAVLRDTSDMGWGFHDQLSDLYYKYKDQVD